MTIKDFLELVGPDQPLPKFASSGHHMEGWIKGRNALRKELRDVLISKDHESCLLCNEILKPPKSGELK